MLYFSYGSFLDVGTLQKHAPTAKFVEKASLPNWELQFNFLSRTYGGGVTGIEPAVGKIVRGALYEVPASEMLNLDTVEGVHDGVYYRQTIIVVDERGGTVRAATYRTTNPRGPFRPTKKYLGLMVKGARAYGFDPEYIRDLENTETID